MSKNDGKILYVDDEESNLTVFEAAFEDVYTVSVAQSGAEALDVLRRNPIEVLVTDMRMPGMSGVELLERVIPEWPDVIRIILTGYTDIDAVVRAINRGQVYQYVPKPWDEREVKILLDRAITRYRAGARERRLRAELAALARKEATIRSVFQRYVPPNVVERVFEENATARSMRGQSQDVVLLFADLRGFTHLCGKLDPPVVLSLMNEYFSVMTEIIDRRGGSVSSYLGDAIVAVFDPTAAADEDRRAVSSALEMVKALHLFNETRAKLVWPSGLRFGVGIQRGRVTTGEIGSEDARAIAIVGETFYQVKEVEEQSKGIDNAIVITEDVVARLDDAFETVPHGVMTLEGLRELKLFRVLSARLGRGRE